MKTIYKLIDGQGMGTKAGFKGTKEEIRQELINYHEIDWTGETPIESQSLEGLLDHGIWDIEPVDTTTTIIIDQHQAELIYAALHAAIDLYNGDMSPHEEYDDKAIEDMKELQETLKNTFGF